MKYKVKVFTNDGEHEYVLSTNYSFEQMKKDVRSFAFNQNSVNFNIDMDNLIAIFNPRYIIKIHLTKIED